MVHAILYTSVAVILLTWFGNVMCRGIFDLTGLKDAVAGEPAPIHVAGRVIGTLERLILATGVLAQSWEVLAAVIALKTVARFRKLDSREFAEYFLVGSLFSVFWSMLIAAAWQAYDHEVGIDLRGKVAAMIGTDDEPGLSIKVTEVAIDCRHYAASAADSVSAIQPPPRTRSPA